MNPANITRDEAVERARHVRTHSYWVEIDLTPGTADAAGMDPKKYFFSKSTVRFSCDGTPTHLNLIAERIVSVVLDGARLPPSFFRDNKIHFSAIPGNHEITVAAWCRYSRTGEGLHRFTDPVDGLVYTYTQFETADARRVYACFEQPDLKAMFDLAVIVPDGWRVVSNSARFDLVELGRGTTRFDFHPTPPISTYITAFAAGPYHFEYDSHPGVAATIPLALACRQSVAPFLDKDRIFETTKRGLVVFESSFGRAYPFSGYSQVFVPEFNAGAMENAGCVMIRDDYLYRSRMTAASYESRDNTILHEMAHMWFGDLVTMTWWDDLWLNESFAEWASHYAQDMIRSRSGLGPDPWATFANSRKTWAYRQDQLPSTHPIAADMVDLEAVELNFDGITYAKGASVIRQLVAFVGQEAFLAGIRAYFTTHAWGNTCLDDLLRALEKASGRDLSTFSEQWLQTTGVNTLRPEIEIDPAGFITRFAIHQTADPNHPTLRRHHIAIGLYEDVDGHLRRIGRVESDIEGEITQIPELVGHPRPALLLVNEGDLTYAKLRLDPHSLNTVVQNIGKIDNPLARALCWGAAWDMCRDGELTSNAWVDLVLRGILAETDQTAVTSILGQARTAIDYYTPRTHRAQLNERFAQGLRELIRQARPGVDHQLALARAFIAAGESPESITTLRAWHRGKDVPTGLIIDNDLRWRLLTQLAYRGVADATDVALEATRDNTAHGAERAAGARAARPTAEAKAAAWRLTTGGEDVANETHYQACLQFWQFDQDALLDRYVDAYRRVVEAISANRDGWDKRGTAIRQHVLELLFPKPLMDRQRLDTMKTWAAQQKLRDSAQRVVAERIDEAERALRCQRAYLARIPTSAV